MSKHKSTRPHRIRQGEIQEYHPPRGGSIGWVDEGGSLRAGPRLDEDALIQPRLHLGSNQPQAVLTIASRAIRHDDADRLVGVVLRQDAVQKKSKQHGQHRAMYVRCGLPFQP